MRKLALLAAVAATALTSTAWAQPVPGQAAREGVPFPSMLSGAAAQTSEQEANLPLAGEPMTVDREAASAKFNKMQQQVETRLQQLTPKGEMAGPDISGHMSELERWRDTTRDIRLMELEQRRAEVAIRLWSTLHDPRKEEEAAKKAAKEAAQEAADKAEVEAASKPSVPAPAAGTPALAGGADAAPGGPSIAAPPSIPLPKVSSIRGGLDGARAVLLVPYVGEVPARIGTKLPGNRVVTSIGNGTVVVSDPDMGKLELGYGDSVPLNPPLASAPGVPAVVAPNLMPGGMPGAMPIPRTSAPIPMLGAPSGVPTPR